MQGVVRQSTAARCHSVPQQAAQRIARLYDRWEGAMISTRQEEQEEAVTATPKVSAMPRLENGDHLTRAEFERRYAAMPDVKKAELIEGMVMMPSPVSNTHSKANSVMVWTMAPSTGFHSKMANTLPCQPMTPA